MLTVTAIFWVLRRARPFMRRVLLGLKPVEMTAERIHDLNRNVGEP
jgi:hypothetical protein